VSIAYPIIPLIYVGMNVWVFLYFVQERKWEAFWSLLTVVAGALAYQLSQRRRPVEAI
jgi:hypothetical protein